MPLPRRDAILLVGDDRMRRVLDYVSWPTVLLASLPLDVVQLLEQYGERIDCVAVSSALPWAKEIRELLVRERSVIRFITVDLGT